MPVVGTPRRREEGREAANLHKRFPSHEEWRQVDREHERAWPSSSVLHSADWPSDGRPCVFSPRRPNRHSWRHGERPTAPSCLFSPNAANPRPSHSQPSLAGGSSSSCRKTTMSTLVERPYYKRAIRGRSARARASRCGRSCAASAATVQRATARHRPVHNEVPISSGSGSSVLGAGCE